MPVDNASVVSTLDPEAFGSDVVASPASGERDESVRIVFDADYQNHLINHVTPIQSVTFDRFIPEAIRPQALVLATPVLQRESQSKIEERFGDYARFHLGDVLDTSDYAEWTVYLLAALEQDILPELFGLSEEASTWTPAQWQVFFDGLNERGWRDYLEAVVAAYEASGEPVRAGPEGNHDGAAWGSGVSQSKSLPILELQVRRYHMQKETLKRRVERMTAKKDRPRVQKRLERLERRLDFVSEKLAVLLVERDRARERFKNFPIKAGRINLPPSVVNAFMGISSQRTLIDPSGYWAQNAGGIGMIFNKADYLFEYLSLRYPEIDLVRSPSEESLFPLATSVVLSPSPQNADHTNYVVKNVKRDAETGAFLKDEGGGFLTELSHVNIENGGDRGAAFAAFWKEVHPGEFLCLINYPGMNEEFPNQHFLMIQAFAMGTVNGKKVFHFFLDGVDGTEQEIDLIYFGFMSRLQRQLCQLFIDEMRARYGGEVLFLHSSHYPLKYHVKDYWKEYGWQSYFAQPDVAPVIFCGHGHSREIDDETKPSLFAKRVFFGTRSVKREGGFWSVMTPSVTDFPNEFMSVELSYDKDRDAYVIGQSYHDVVEEHDVDGISPDVARSVAHLRMYYEKHHYHEYSQLQNGLLPRLQNIFFSQDRILAYDAIPVSVGQFREVIAYAREYLRFLEQEFGEETVFVRLVRQTLKALEEHYERWLYGNPDADNEFDRHGYLWAVREANKYARRQDRLALLLHYNDIFDTPAYERLRLLIAQTPKDSKAYEFWLLLGKEAAAEEKRPKNKRQARRWERRGVPDKNEFVFRAD